MEGYDDRGWLEGKYIGSNEYFSFDFATYDNSHISIIPEPATILLLGIGSILFRKKR
jgi:hypothetical protein